MDSTRNAPNATTRRNFLCSISIAGVIGLAGCQKEAPGSTTKRAPTDTISKHTTTSEIPAQASTSKTTTASPTATTERSDIPSDRPISGTWPMFQYTTKNIGHNPTAVGPTTGVRERWTVTTSHRIRSSPAIANDTVYIGVGNRLRALRLADGKEQWHASADGPIDASPTITGGLAFFNTDAGTIYAVETETGRVRWQTATEQTIPAKTPRTSSPTVADDAVYVGLHAGGMYSFDASTGDRRWHTKLDGAVIGSAPAIADDTLFTGHTDGELVAIDTGDGGIKWRTQLAKFVTCPPTIFDGRVFVGAADGRVYEVMAETGKVNRTFETEYNPDLPGSPLRKINASPAIADGLLFTGSNDYHAYAWDLQTGDRQWRFRVGGRCYTAPAVVDGVVYVGGVSGKLYGLDAATGEKLWSFQASGELLDSSPAVVNNGIAIGDGDGSVYLLEARE